MLIPNVTSLGERILSVIPFYFFFWVACLMGFFFGLQSVIAGDGNRRSRFCSAESADWTQDWWDFCVPLHIIGSGKGRTIQPYYYKREGNGLPDIRSLWIGTYMIFSLVTSSVSEQLLCAGFWGGSSHAHVFAALVFPSAGYITQVSCRTSTWSVFSNFCIRIGQLI